MRIHSSHLVDQHFVKPDELGIPERVADEKNCSSGKHHPARAADQPTAKLGIAMFVVGGGCNQCPKTVYGAVDFEHLPASGVPEDKVFAGHEWNSIAHELEEVVPIRGNDIL